MTAPGLECMNDKQMRERQALLELFLMGCREIGACPACAMATAFYAAAQAAQKGLVMTEEKFLDAAREIWKDVEQQLKPGPPSILG
jgi:hypothetical protein